MATLVVGSFIKHCCAIPVVVFAQLVYEAKEVVLEGFSCVLYLSLFNADKSRVRKMPNAFGIRDDIFVTVKQNEQCKMDSNR